MYSKNVYLTNVCYLFVGLSAGGRVGVGTNYLNEFLPYDWQNTVTSLLNVADAAVLITQSIYYYFFQHWKYLHIAQFIMAILIIMIVATIPESPKYLYANKRFDDAR